MTTGSAVQAAAAQPSAAARLCSRETVGRRQLEQQAAGCRQQQPQNHTIRQRLAGIKRQSNTAALGSVAAGEVEDQSVRVRIMLAENSGRLDLSECGLHSVPPAVFELEGESRRFWCLEESL